MLGLFGALNLGARALQTQQQAVEVAGQNLANVNNPAYARQRVAVQTSLSIPTSVGPQGTGVEAVAITQVRDALLDRQIQGEASITGFLESQQTALQYGNATLGEQIDSSSTSATNSTGNTSSGNGIGDSLSGLFNAFQTLSTAPASLTNRQAAVSVGQELATQFNQVDQRLLALNGQLNESVQTDVASANQLLSDIAGLNKQIGNAEATTSGTANDLRDLRQQKIESLSKLVNLQTTTSSDGELNLSVDGNLLVSGQTVQDTLEAYDPGSGNLMVRTATAGTPLALTGGSIQGTITARDGALASLHDGLNSLATELISQVNAIYSSGYDLDGNTGGTFFSGTNASDISVTSTLLNDPSKLQASGVAGAAGDNQVALALGQLANTKQAGLGNQTFAENYNATVTALGSSLSSVNNQLDEQNVVQNMLQTQRSSVSGVSIDEEMTDLVKFQKAFQAAARLVTTISDMLDEVVNLKR